MNRAKRDDAFESMAIFLGMAGGAFLAHLFPWWLVAVWCLAFGVIHLLRARAWAR